MKKPTIKTIFKITSYIGSLLIVVAYLIYVQFRISTDTGNQVLNYILIAIAVVYILFLISVAVFDFREKHNKQLKFIGKRVYKLVKILISILNLTLLIIGIAGVSNANRYYSVLLILVLSVIILIRIAYFIVVVILRHYYLKYSADIIELTTKDGRWSEAEQLKAMNLLSKVSSFSNVIVEKFPIKEQIQSLQNPNNKVRKQTTNVLSNIARVINYSTASDSEKLQETQKYLNNTREIILSTKQKIFEDEYDINFDDISNEHKLNKGQSIKLFIDYVNENEKEVLIRYKKYLEEKEHIEGEKDEK